MSRILTPIRPKPSSDGSEAFPVLDSTVHYTPEPMRNSKLPVKDEMDPAHQPVDESKPLGSGAGHRPALFEEPQAFEPEQIHQTSDNNDSIPMWPSEIHNMGDTTWLLPAYSDQSSTLASVLRTEIQSHNITREMLHNTERRRLEGAQRCKHLQADIERWAAAYNNLTATSARCAEEFSRLSAENLELKTKLNASPINVPSLGNKQTGYRYCGNSHGWNDAQLSPSSTTVDTCHGRDTGVNMTDTYESPCASDFSAFPYSPEV